MATDTQISIRLTSEQLERAQKLADKAGITRHKLLHNLVTVGLDSLDDLNSVGILNAVLAVRNIENYFKSFKNGSNKLDQEQEA